MPSKYILLRLAQTPFVEPAASKKRLGQEFIDELDVRRQGMALSHEQEGQDLVRQANEVLSRAKSKEAKKYVWTEFAHALNPDEGPHLFMAGYQWLQEHREFAPARKNSLLNWSQDDSFSYPSLLCAASQLPKDNAIEYIASWVVAQQKELATSDGAPRILPVKKMRLNAVIHERYNTGWPGYQNQLRWEHQNQILWGHVLVVALPLLPESIKHPLNVPYLPFFLEHSFVESLLNKVPPGVQTWILSNGLLPGDFYPSKAHTIDDAIAIQSFSRFASMLTNEEDKAFAVWDMIHRHDDTCVAENIVATNFPHVKNILGDLGLLQIDCMRQAMLREWHKPAQTLMTMELPSGLDADLAS